MKCLQCGIDSKSKKKFCTQCGEKLTLNCPQCDTEIEEKERFCGACGYDLGKAKEAPSINNSILEFDTSEMMTNHIVTARDTIEGERRPATVLFADMVGYTAQTERLGEERSYLVLKRVIVLLIDTVSEYGGTVQDLAGDGIVALFGVPVALEDAPQRACHAAMAIQEKMDALSHRIEVEHGVRPKLRIGINSGPVVVGSVGTETKTEMKAVGDTINMAARIESLAKPGHVLLSEETHRLVEDFIESNLVGEHQIKGKLHPQKTWELVSVKPDVARFEVAVRRGLTRFVGREEQLDILKDCWQKASLGETFVVNISGEAGIGKSRVIHEFRQHLGQEQAFFLQGHCMAEGRMTPFLPFIQVIRSIFRLSDHGNPLETAKRLRVGLEILDLKPEKHLPYLANLLGQDTEGALHDQSPDLIGARTRQTLQVVLLERCRLSPIVLSIDDLHWIDVASENFLLWITQAEEEIPLLMLCAYRPEYGPPWSGRDNVTGLILRPLSCSSTIDLLKYRIGAEDIQKDLTDFLVDKSEGNPLFAEEMVSYLLETGRVKRGESGGLYKSEDEADLGIGLPGTLANLLMERFDRVEGDSKELMKVASVVGRRFSSDVAGEVCGFSENLSEHLEKLERKDLIFTEREDGSIRYCIKHALIQDAVYNSLLTEERERLHAAVGATIERIYADRVSEVADVLAHHYSRTPQNEKTIRFLALAGERSLRVYSIDDAYDRLRQAIDLVETHPGLVDNEFIAEMVLNLARIYYFRCDFASIFRTVEHYLPIVEATGNKRLLSRFLFELGYSHMVGARAEVGKPLLERSLALGRETGDEKAINHAVMGLIFHHVFWEELGPAQRKTVQSLEQELIKTAKPAGDYWPLFKGLFGLAMHVLLCGNPSEARRLAQRLMEYSREMNDHRPKALGLVAQAMIDALSGNTDDAVEKADEARRLAMTPFDHANADAIMGVALTMAGRAAAARDLLKDVRQRLISGELLIVVTVMDLQYGVAQVMSGELGKGVEFIKETMQRFAKWGFRHGHGLGHLTLGNVYLNIALMEEKPAFGVIIRNIVFLLRTVPFAAAKAQYHLEEAESFFRSVDAPALRASALMSLGLLAKAKKRYEEARAYLEEAFQSSDVVDGRVLCEKIDAVLEILPKAGLK